MAKEKTYELNAMVTISLRAKVSAKNRKEALDKANELILPGLCHQCSGGEELVVDADEWTLSGDLDGEPFDVEIDSVEKGD